MQAIQEPQQAAMPLIKVYLTDVQFEELKHILSTNISEDLMGIHFLVWIEIPCQIFLYKKEDICCPLVIQ